MFWPKKKPTPMPAPTTPKPTPEPTYTVAGWVALNTAGQAVRAAATCKARGRYELAQDFQRRGADWYGRNVANSKPMPGETAEDKQRYRDYWEEYKAEIGNLGLLTADRDALLALLRAAPEGLNRAALEQGHPLKGRIKYGVLLNQLSKGGWVRQEGEGKAARYYLSGPLMPEAEFLKRELFKG